MRTVQSKYKNPDKLVERLRGQLKCQDETNQWLSDREGVWLHSLTCPQESNRWGTMYDGLVPGDTLVAICSVEEVRLYSEKDKRAGHINITVRQIRKRK